MVKIYWLMIVAAHLLLQDSHRLLVLCPFMALVSAFTFQESVGNWDSIIGLPGSTLVSENIKVFSHTALIYMDCCGGLHIEEFCTCSQKKRRHCIMDLCLCLHCVSWVEFGRLWNFWLLNLQLAGWNSTHNLIKWPGSDRSNVRNWIRTKFYSWISII